LVGATDERDRLARALDVETAQREMEGAARETELRRLAHELDAARAEAGTLTMNTARLEAQFVAAGERARDLTARFETLSGERDVARERAAVLDARLE